MKNDLNKTLGLDSIPDELKADETAQEMRDRWHSPGIDPDKTHVATLAMEFYPAMMDALCLYADELKAYDLPPERKLKDPHIVGALVLLALAMARVFSRIDGAPPFVSQLREAASIKAALDCALNDKSMTADLATMIENFKKFQGLPEGMHHEGLGFSFGVISRKNKK